MFGMNRSAVLALLLAACSSPATDKPAARPGSTAAPVDNKTAEADSCATAVDKLFAMLAPRGFTPEPGQRDGAIDECRKNPSDPTIKCINDAKDEAAIEACMNAPKGEPIDQLDAMVEKLRTLFFVHETFANKQVPLTPAKACCSFPTKHCPPEKTPDEFWAVLELDLTTGRDFQYRLEATDKKAVLTAIGDRDCDGRTVTYRRELEWRSDGNMHITVDDPPAGSD